jgi:hypothetical protein
MKDRPPRKVCSNQSGDTLGFASGLAGLGRRPDPAGTSAATATIVASPDEVSVCV